MERTPPSPAGHEGDARRGDRAFPWVLLIVAAIVGALLATLRPDRTGEVPVEGGAVASRDVPPWTPAPRPEGDTVSLTIDFGNGARRQWDALPFVPDMTLGALMQEARKFQPPLAFTQQGDGEMAYLTSLESVDNEGGGGRNWMYSVDGEFGKVSFALRELEAGDAVLWEFRQPE
jgi:hypothetical protein